MDHVVTNPKTASGFLSLTNHNVKHALIMKHDADK
jgi:hypothetical protein